MTMQPEPPAGLSPEPAVSSCPGVVQKLRRRQDFVACARGARMAMPGFVLQARRRGTPGPPRIGFTCSRKVGSAVVRNRAKRRLREIARLHLAPLALPGWDYVLIGRRDATVARPFACLAREATEAISRLHDRHASPAAPEGHADAADPKSPS